VSGARTIAAVFVTALLSTMSLVGCDAGDGETGPDTVAAPVQRRATAADPDPTAAWFADHTSAAGVDFTYRSGHDGTRFPIPETIGGGGALLDIDGDGDLDLYLVQGGSLDAGAANPPNELYRNDGRGTFSPVPGAGGADDRGYGMGAATGDYDGDGDLDLYVTNLGPDRLYRNDGDGTFTDVTGAAGAGVDGWSSSAAFVDVDHDGDLDLYVCRYLHWSWDVERDCVDAFGRPDYCTPRAYEAPATDVLLRNEGDGTFTDVSEAAGIASAPAHGLGVVCGDYDGDGWVDVYVANDAMDNLLWINQGDGTFVDRALISGCALPEDAMPRAGMGVVSEDVDDDGDLDILVVNLTNESDTFFRAEDGAFVDRTAQVGLVAHARPSTRFGVGLVDLDRDGWLDLYQAAGRVMRAERPDDPSDPYAQPNLLYRGTPSGRYEFVRPMGGTDPPLIETSRAALFGDLDDDGGVDLVVVNRDGPAHVLMNVHPPAGNWVGLDLRDAGGAPAIGARVSVLVGDRTITRLVRTGWGYLSANDHRIVIGVGDEPHLAGMIVRWPDGTVRNVGRALEAGRYHRIERAPASGPAGGD